MDFRLKRYILLLLIFLIPFGAYSYFNRDKGLRDHEVESRMALIKAMVDEQTLQIDSYQDTLFATRDKAFYNGHYYSDKAIGAQVLGAIVYKIILWVCAKAGWILRFKYFRDVITIFTIGSLSATLAPLLYLLMKRLSPSMPEGTVMLIVFTTALGTPFFKFGTLFYGHTLAGVFFLSAFIIWFIYHQSGVITWGRVFLSGFLLGWMVITEYPTAILAMAMAIYILIILWKNQRLLDWKIYSLLILGAVFPISILLFYNYACFGNIFSLSYAHEATEKFRIAQSAGLFGIELPDPQVIFYMTFHPTMGIFWQSPILLLAIPGWFYLFKSNNFRVEGIFSLFTIGIYLVFFSGYFMWWGGSSFTPRHLIPILPLFIIPLSALPRKYSPFVIAAGIISICQMLIVAAGNSDGLGELVTRAFETHTLTTPSSTIYNIYFTNLIHGLFVQNLGESLFKIEGFASFIPLILYEAGMISLLIFVARKADRIPELTPRS